MKTRTQAQQIANFHSGSVLNDTTGCLEWQRALSNSGYGQFWYQGKDVRTHRLAFELHHGRPITEGMILLHSCDNPKCCKPDHLREGTMQENMDDRNSKNRQAKGETNGSSKLTETQVLEIREKYQTLEDCTQAALANEFGVSQSRISDIINNKTWNHI